MNNPKSKWALVPIGVVGVAIAGVAAYAKIQGTVDAKMEHLSADVSAITLVLPEIRDRLTAIETDIAWIKRGMNQQE